MVAENPTLRPGRLRAVYRALCCGLTGKSENGGWSAWRKPGTVFDLTPCAEKQSAVLGQNATCHRRCRSEASDWNLGFRGGALHSRSESSAVEPGESQMENVG